MNKSQLSAATRLFSPTVFKQLAVDGQSALFSRLAIHSGLVANTFHDCTIGDFFESAFKQIRKKNARSEYIYKAAITKDILLKRHKLNEACMLSEFRVENRKADTVILNGTATAYEIKSEKDNLLRIQDQISAYLKVFPEVSVIAAEGHIDTLIRTLPQSIGLFSLTARGGIYEIRKPLFDIDRTIPCVVFKSLQTKEAEYALRKLGYDIPELPNTIKNKFLKSIFSDLNPNQAHEAMLTALKKYRNNVAAAHLIEHIPPSLHSLAVTTKLSTNDRERLISTIKTPLAVVTNWS